MNLSPSILKFGNLKQDYSRSTQPQLYPTLSPAPLDYNNDFRQLLLDYISAQNYATALMLCVSASNNSNNLVAASLIFSIIEKAMQHSDGLLEELYSLCCDHPASIASRYALGLMHIAGCGQGTQEEKDKLAVKYFTEGMNEEYAPAQSYLGFMYARGRSVSENNDEAARLYKLAAEQGDALGQYFLGRMYYHGCGVPKDHVEAARLYKLAAEQGDAPAQYNLGRMYEHGHGVSTDNVEAARLYKLAAEQGNALAQYNLGRMYYIKYGALQNYDEAACLFQAAANQGNTKAKNFLKKMYKQGHGKVSPETENVYFNTMDKLKARKNLYLFQLGMLYLEGMGVDKQSHSQARKHLSEAEKLGHPSASFYLGKSYSKTAGFWSASGRRDHNEAKNCYIRAAQSGNKQVEARSVLKEVYPEDKTIYLTAPPPPSNLKPEKASIFVNNGLKDLHGI